MHAPKFNQSCRQFITSVAQAQFKLTSDLGLYVISYAIIGIIEIEFTNLLKIIVAEHFRFNRGRDLNVASERCSTFVILKLTKEIQAIKVTSYHSSLNTNMQKIPAEQSLTCKPDTTTGAKSTVLKYRKLFKWAKHAWQRLQIGHRSMYSVERLYALDDYYRNVSQARIIAVCLLTPLPALLLVVALELIPLQNPNDGCANNYGAWARFGVISFTVGLGLAAQMKSLTVGISIPTWKLVAISLATSLCHVCITITIGNFWVFPVPFSFVLTMPPFLCCMAIFSFIAVGREGIACAPNLRHQLRRQVQVIISQSGIAIFYTGLSAVFATLPSHEQIAFVALLPLIKLIFKNLMASVSAFLEEYVSGIVVFSVELAHALFSATCMQTARSPLASAVIISLDMLSSILSLRSIFRTTRTVQKLLLNYSKIEVLKSQSQLIAMAKRICQDPEIFACGAFRASNLLLRSPLSLKLSTDSHRALAKITVSQAQASKGSQDRISKHRSKTQAVLTQLQLPFRSLRITPSDAMGSVRKFDPRTTPLVPIVPVPPPIGNLAEVSSSTTIDDQVKLVCETAQLMFHCEYIVLIEYVECVIPMIYGLYLQSLCRLGGLSRTYYPQTRDITLETLNSAVGHLVVYVWLEVLSLLVLHVVFQRRFGFSIIRQLAFVLETHVMQVQGRMFMWVAFILTFTLEHFGAYFVRSDLRVANNATPNVCT